MFFDMTCQFLIYKIIEFCLPYVVCIYFRQYKVEVNNVTVKVTVKISYPWEPWRLASRRVHLAVAPASERRWCSPSTPLAGTRSPCYHGYGDGHLQHAMDATVTYTDYSIILYGNDKWYTDVLWENFRIIPGYGAFVYYKQLH